MFKGEILGFTEHSKLNPGGNGNLQTEVTFESHKVSFYNSVRKVVS
jgi:hypothetical protein